MFAGLCCVPCHPPAVAPYSAAAARSGGRVRRRNLPAHIDGGGVLSIAHAGGGARRGSPVIGRPATFYPHVPTVAASGPVLTSGPAVPKMNTVPTATPPKPRKPAPPRPPQQPQQDAPAPGTAPSLTHAEMMELAKKYPPPQSWYDDDTDPFTPAPAPVEK